MKISINLKKSIHENAAVYFDESKKWRKKAEGAKKAIEQMQTKILRSQPAPLKMKEKRAKVGWYGEYRHCATKNGFIVVAGKDAKQNDQLVARHMKEGDLFFHADVIGAPATLLKGTGRPPQKEDLLQAAQFAASYSRAWKQNWHAVDVYAVPPAQVNKYSQGEFVGKGAFIITGERQWFRNTLLKLYLAKEGDQIAVIPEAHSAKPADSILIAPGSVLKEQAAKQLARKFHVREEALLTVLPGDVEIK